MCVWLHCIYNSGVLAVNNTRRSGLIILIVNMSTFQKISITHVQCIYKHRFMIRLGLIIVTHLFHIFQVVGVGSACVGKTCLVKHFCESKVCLDITLKIISPYHSSIFTLKVEKKCDTVCTPLESATGKLFFFQ